MLHLLHNFVQILMGAACAAQELILRAKSANGEPLDGDGGRTAWGDS